MPNTSKLVEIDHVREKLFEFVHDARMNAHWHGAKDPIKYMVDMLIANGVTIPVRCKDCKHSTQLSNEHPDDLGCRYWCCDTEPDGFCHKGERRTDGI